MAKAREIPAPDPPVESEESESEEEEGSEESESEPEPEVPATAKKAPSTPAAAAKKPDPKAAAPAESSSSEEEESGSETDTDSPPKKADPNVKPITSKPMSEPEKKAAATKAPRASAPTSPARPAAGAGAKRLATPTADADGKRPKRKAAENSEKKGAFTDEGKKLFERLWSKGDEIIILQGYIDYFLKNKKDPMSNSELNDFYNSTKSRISFPVTKVQLQDKFRRLKRKYRNNVKKEKNGKDRTFSDPHEQQTYELCKKIWGNEKIIVEEAPEVTPKANGTPVRNSRSKGSAGTSLNVEEAKEEVMEEKGLVSDERKSISYVHDGRPTEEWVFSDGTELVAEEDRADLEKQWKKLRIEEAGILVKRLELSHKHAKKVYEALKSSRD